MVLEVYHLLYPYVIVLRVIVRVLQSEASNVVPISTIEGCHIHAPSTTASVIDDVCSSIVIRAEVIPVAALGQSLVVSIEIEPITTLVYSESKEKGRVVNAATKVPVSSNI